MFYCSMESLGKEGVLLQGGQIFQAAEYLETPNILRAGFVLDTAG